MTSPCGPQLLEYCTEKLFMPTAARRLFLDDGSEVFTPKEIPRDAEVYISCGEPFKNPFIPVKSECFVGMTTKDTGGCSFLSSSKILFKICKLV